MATTNDVELFISSIANTPLKKELIWLLHENRVMDTYRGLASWMNRREADVREAAEELANAGLLRRIGEGEEAVYQYAPPPELAPVIEKFIASYVSARSLLSDYLSELQSTIEEIQKASLKEVKLERSKLKSIIQSMPVGVIVVDMSGEIVLYNSSAAFLLNMEESDMHITKAFSHESLTPILDAIERVLKEGRLVISRELEIPSGCFINVIVTPVYGDEGIQLGAVAILRDVTELKRLDQLKMEFVLSLSHDIRSPLTAIKGFALSLLRGVFGKLLRKQSKVVELILNQSDKIESMVEKLTEAMKAMPETFLLHTDVVDLNELVNECVTSYLGIAIESGIELKANLSDEPVIVTVDRDAILRVISNLVDNAIKYTPSGGKVTVSVSQTNEFATIEVVDTGVGIPPEDLPKIFTPFSRLKHAEGEAEKKGVGLGLAIAKRLTEAHGGKITVESKVGHGSKFVVILPRHQYLTQQT